MAEHVGLSPATIRRLWRAFGLKPHLVEKNFNLSDDTLLVGKVRDIARLYMSPPDNAVVYCVLSVRSPFSQWTSANPRGRPVHTYDTARWTCSPRCMSRPGGFSARFERASVPDRDRWDGAAGPQGARDPRKSLSTHKTPAVHRWLLKHPTSICTSPLRMPRGCASLDCSPPTRSVVVPTQLRRAVCDYLHAHNDAPTPFKWAKTADEILASIARFATRTLEAHREG